MATAAVPAPAIDLRAPSTFNVRLGKSVLNDGESKRHRNIRYNYKPPSSHTAGVTSKLLPGKQANTSTLSVKKGENEWKYSGRYRDDEDMYVLVLSGEGKKDAVLEKLGSSHAVNLTCAPEDDNAESLARKYRQLKDENSEEDDDGILVPEDELEDAEPDSSNPFDFRHFMKSIEADPHREEAPIQPSRNATGTPLQRAATSTPVARPAKPTPASAAVKKRKTPAATATRPNPKRVRAGEDPPATSAPSAKPAAMKTGSVPIPEVHLDRKASIREPPPSSAEKRPQEADDSDDGELVLENSTGPNNKQNSTHLSAMSLALSGALGSHGSGPISLRSAASSPGGRLNSPHPDSADKPEAEEFEFGGGSSPAEEQHEFEFVDHDDDEDGEDGDVEDLELPSPSQPEPPRQPSRSRRASLAVPAGDDEDDMEAQLALAMAADEEEEESAPMARIDESDEDVSEEE